MIDQYGDVQGHGGLGRLRRRKFISNVGLTAGAIVVWPAWNDFAEVTDGTSSAVNGKSFKFETEPPRNRKSFYDLTDDELLLLCKAMSQMRNGSKDVPLSMSSPRQWDQWVLIHEKHCTEDGPGVPQVHWSWFFLPWHRAYLWFLERHLAYILKHDLGIQAGDSFALPYWDWISHKDIPNTRLREIQNKPSPLFGYNQEFEDMVNDDNLGFDNMALWDGNRGPTLQKPKMDPANEITNDSKEHVQETLNFTSAEFIQGILGLPFEYFAGKAVISRQDGQGVLEIGPHNDVHDWVGSRLGKNRDMGTLRYAALDPIFFMHHANIDRIWSWYRKSQPDPDTSPWGTQSYVFSDVDGSPVTVTVKDIIKSMTNVSYAAPQGIAPESAAMLLSLQTTSKKSPTVSTEVLVETPQVLTVHPLTLNVQSKSETKGLLSSEAIVKEQPLAVLEIETGPITYRDKFTIRVFVNKPDADRNTKISDQHYVGRISGLDSESRGGEAKEERSHTFPILLERGANFYKLVQPGQSFKVTLVAVGPAAGDEKFSIQVRSMKFKIFQ